MTTNNSSNIEVTKDADGGRVSLGVTKRILRWFGADITIEGTGTETHTFPATSSILLSDQPSEFTGFTAKTTPVDADIIAIEDSADSNEKKKVTWANIKATLKTYFDTLYPPQSGWLTMSQTWTYASADDPVYQIYVSGDVTTDVNYKLGNKIKCTNNATTVYGFIVKVGAYDAGNTRTPVDIYGGTDYNIANSAITAPCISKIKSPDGFPISPEKWTVSLTNTSNVAQATPTNNTYYNLGSLSIDIPIGVWRAFFSLTGEITVTTTAIRTIGIVSAMSTSTSSATDNELRVSQQITGPTGANINILLATRDKTLAVTAKTTYYLICLGSVPTNAITSIAFRGDFNTTMIRIICAYL